MLNPQFVAGEHGLFGGHKSEDIRTFFTTFFAIKCTELTDLPCRAGSKRAINSNSKYYCRALNIWLKETLISLSFQSKDLRYGF